MKISVGELRKARAIAVLSVSEMIVTAGLLFLMSGSYYLPTIAQQVVTEGNTTAGEGAQSFSACTPAQVVTAGDSSTTTNTTDITAGGDNQSTKSQVRTLIEQACIAAQSNETQVVLMHLNSALNALGGGDGDGGMEDNISRATMTGDNGTTGGEGGVSVGGTSAADDYDGTADDDP
jgi:hypothetical protein